MKMSLLISVLILTLGVSCKTDTPIKNLGKKESITPAKPQEMNHSKKIGLAEEEMTSATKNAKAIGEEVKSYANPSPVKKIEKQGQPEPKELEKTKEVKASKPVIKNPPPIKKMEAKPIIFFPDTLHNYGFIDEGDTIRHSFRFLNDGTVPLEILDVQVSCGCTIPVYPLTNIEPGRLSKIDITFLSSGKLGPQEATIDILSNASKPIRRLYLKGVIR
jgi:hypothetical protein